MTGTRFESAHFRQVMGHLPTGVSVVTGHGADGPAGLAIGSFMSVSLQPPLIAISPALSSASWPAIRATGRFCVNVLAAGQTDLALGFAVSGGEKFADLEWHLGPGGSPVLDGAVAWVDCRIASEQEAGDHWLVLGSVEELDLGADGEPLIFHRGAFDRFRPADRET
ncbi:MAG TPA: flavin reductase family protein [Solirubrobacterales bacterium]|nr:flavin reductase family protein [Solirubrobacterales bacterium]